MECFHSFFNRCGQILDLHELVVASGFPAMVLYTTLQRWVFFPKVDHHALLVSLRLLFLLKSPTNPA